MISKSLRNVQVNVKRFMANAAPKAAPSSIASGSNQVKVSALPSGLVIASVDTDVAIARIAVSIRAGSRYEPEANLGITHTLRSAAGLATKNFSNFGITRNIEYYGSSLSVIGQRDTITYLLEAHNEESLLQNHFAMLADTISNPEFKHWELSDNLERMRAELEIVESSPQIILSDALHKAAFKGGLRKSLYSSRQMLGKHSTQDLLNYVKKRYVSPNTVVVGYGVDHNQLLSMVNKGIVLDSATPGKCNAKYVGGELHIDDPSSPLTYVALAAESTGLSKPKDELATALFQFILGVDGKNGRLANVISKSSGDPSTKLVSAFNMSYEETGLFGINLIVPSSEDVAALLKSAIKELKATGSNVSEAELTEAKTVLKTSMQIAAEKPENLVTDMSVRLLIQGKESNISELCKEVDSITIGDIKAVAGKISKGKPSLATVGKNAPYLSDIIE